MPVKPRRPFARLRKLMLAALVLLVGGLAALFFFGRAGRRAERPGAGDGGGAARSEEGMTLIGEDFDYTFTEEEKPVFRIRGESIRADRQETLFLDDVALTLYDEQGRSYHVESREASFNRTTNEGRLRGDVHLKGPSDLELRAAVLRIQEKGRVLLSPRPVRIAFAGRYAARAERMRAYVPEELFILQGKVRVESLPGQEPPLALAADRVIYERGKRQVRVEGGVALDRGADHLECQRITGFLSPDERSLVFLRALWGVTGRAAATTETGSGREKVQLRFRGEDLAVQFEPAAGPEPRSEARKVELSGVKGKPARLESSGGGVTRVLVAPRVEGMMAGGALTTANATGGVEIREAGPPPSQASRRATGERADATFRPDGQLARVALAGGITYRDPELAVKGDRGEIDMDAGQGDFHGAPVEVEAERGRLVAPHVAYTREGSLLHADGGVRAVLEKVEETAFSGTPLAQGEGPVRVESKEAFWREQPQAFLFRGDVRAWRGENLLLAAEVRGDQVAPEQNRLTAGGGVKTLWMPSAERAARRSEDEGAAAEKGPTRPVEVTSAGLVYREGEGLLTYSGDVRVTQEGKVLLCQELQVELGEEREAETMTCTGEARLNDPQTGRRIEGQRAVYHVADKVIEMFGDPVVMLDREGNKVRGRRLLYHMDDGKVEVKGEGPSESQPPAPAASPVGTGAER